MNASDSNPPNTPGSSGGDAPTLRIEEQGNVGDCLEKRGDFIGPYRLMEQVGEGGFGTVWRAEQTKPVHREVALKVIKPGMDSREIIARFEAERQALAMMDHPNIARMLDGGTTASGRPYFAMEFVKGEPVNAFCDARKLSIAERIPIFLDICSAVQHAHQKAILHRDLKPSNILVTEIGGRVVPKVIDFGVAKALGQQLTDKTMFTAIGLAIGTPEYMSPEQAGAGNQDVDTRSDVYSLGVILYELLIGSTPLRRDEVRKMMIHQLMEVLRTQDAERPSTRFQHLQEATRRQVAAARHMEFTRLQKFLRGDLDWIVMRALEKDRSRRYQTVNALALDLQRYLKGDPVEAGPPSASYRLGKMAKRYRGSLLAASLVMASIIAGLCFTVWQAARATKAEKLASQRFGEAEQARDAAENLISEAVYGLRKKLMAVGKVEVMEEMVAAADGYYRRLPAELYDDDAKRHLASLALNRAIIAEVLGQDAEYEKHTREALRLTEELAARHPDDEKLQDEVCFSMLNLCNLYWDRNDGASLFPMADATVARCEEWLKKKPRSIWAMRYQVLAHNWAAQTLTRYLKKLPEGLARFQAAEQIARRMREIAGETAEVCEAEGFIHYGKANVAQRMGNMELNLSEFEQSTASFKRALELGGDSALLREMYVGALHHYGNFFRESARAKGDAAGEKRGEEMVREAFEARRKLVDLEPGRAEWWRDLAYSHLVLGAIARQKSGPAAQVQEMKEALRCRDEAVKRQPNRPQLYDERGMTRSSMAGVALLLDPPDPKLAAELTLRSFEDWKRAVEMSGFAPLMRSSIKGDIQRLANIASGDQATALPWLVEARKILGPLTGKVSGKNDLAGAFGLLLETERDALTKLGRTAEAQEVTAIIAAQTGGQTTPNGMHEIGRSILESARAEFAKVAKLPEAERQAALEKAEARRVTAQPLLEQAVAKEPANLDFRESLGNSWLLKGRIEKSVGHPREAVAAVEKALTIFDAEKQTSLVADAHFEAGEVLQDSGDFPAAAPHLKTAIRLRDERCAQKSPAPGATNFADAGKVWSVLANTQYGLNDMEGSLNSLREAVKRRKRAHELAPNNRAFHWDLLQSELDTVLRLSKCGQPIPSMDAAAPSLKDIPALLEDQADRGRLSRMTDYPLMPVFTLLRDEQRLPEAAQVLRHIIAMKERAEALEGGVNDLPKSSIRARITLVALLDQQKLTDQSAAELSAAVAAAEKTGQPALLAETHSALRAYFESVKRSEDAERHARAAFEIAGKTDLGWRGIRIATDLSSTLQKRSGSAEAEKIALAAWEKASAQKWPDEPANLRADIAARLCDIYHSMHMQKPDAARDAAARVWVQRAAEHSPLDRQKTENEFGAASLNWMGWLAELAGDGKLEDYRRDRTALLKTARNFSRDITRERVAKAALLIPGDDAETRQAAALAAEAFRSKPDDEWMRIGHCIALLRTGKPQECLDTAQPILKSTDITRTCNILAVTALAHRRLGHHAEADAILAGLEKDSVRAKQLSSPTQRDAILTRVLLKEARQK